MRLIGLVLTLTLTLAPLAAEPQQRQGKAAKSWCAGYRARPTACQCVAGRSSRPRLHRRQNIVVDYRYAKGQDDVLPTLASELVRLNVDVIFTTGTPAALAAKHATKTIPIVATIVADPVAIGLVTTLARPGGNITGLANVSPDLAAKQLQLSGTWRIPRLDYGETSCRPPSAP